MPQAKAHLIITIYITLWIKLLFFEFHLNM